MTDPTRAADTAHDHHGHGGFHGPKCWVVSALVGVLLGVALSFIMPARSGSHDQSHDAGSVLVVETRPDNTQHLRLGDESTRPIKVRFDPGDPADVAALVEETKSAPTDGGSAQADHGHGGHGPTPEISLVLCVPFALLLLSIALMPFINERFWHAHFPDFAFLLGSMMLTYYLIAFREGGFGKHEMLHAGLEYYAFIALVGGLYVVSGGILIDVRFRGRPLTNTTLLAFGAVLANIVGTTGASVLLIRPFMRMNHGRLRPLHVVFFIFIVSNCGGCLTPIGDPPLYLGFLKGVPFFWTLSHLWPMWLLVNGLLLGLFAIVDSRIPPDPARVLPGHAEAIRYEHKPLITGWSAVAFLIALVACVFVDPLIKQHAPGSKLVGLPVGATLQIILAVAAFITTKPSIRNANQFTFGPVKEVGFLFIGIFLTMAPALGYLRANAMSFGLESPSQFYFGTGGLSACLDNAPTYLSFLQVAFGVLHLPLSPDGIGQFLANTFDIVHTDSGTVAHFNGLRLLEGISLGAVFFGAMTYIGNGPNFMVKSIVEAAARQDSSAPGDSLGVRMPSFFGYLLLACIILLPVLVINWFIFIR